MPNSQLIFVQNNDFLWVGIRQHGGGLGIKNKFFNVEGGVWGALAYISYGRNMHTIKIDGVFQTVVLI